MRVRLTKPITVTATKTIEAGTIVNLNRNGEVVISPATQYVQPAEGDYEVITYKHGDIPLVEGRTYDVTVQRGHRRDRAQTLRGWQLTAIEAHSWDRVQWSSLTFRKDATNRHVYVNDIVRLEPVNG